MAFGRYIRRWAAFLLPLVVGAVVLLRRAARAVAAAWCWPAWRSGKLRSMQSPIRRDRLVIGLSVLALVAALGTASVGFVLAEVYRPHVQPVPFRGLSSSEELRESAAWSDWHGRLSLLFLAASVGLSAALAWFAYRARLSAARAVILLVSSGFAVVTAIVTIWTRATVEWHQVAMWAVTNDFDDTGYLLAAFNDDVRFVLIDGREVSKGEYGMALVAHLGAPVIGTVALLIATAALVQVVRARSAPSGAVETPVSGDVSVP